MAETGRAAGLRARRAESAGAPPPRDRARVQRGGRDRARDRRDPRVRPGLEIVVVDDGSADRTAEVARGAGAHVLRLPFNLGIGGAVQTGFRYAFERGLRLAVRVDGDGQHDPAQLGAILAPVLAGEADIVVGSRFAGESSFRSSRSRRLGIRILAWTVSALVRQRVTDPTSGFQALNRHGIALFAADYPHDYPEVEATVMVFRHRLRLREVPVAMRERGGGPLVDHGAAPLDLLHGEGAARDLRRALPPQRRPARGRGRAVTPLNVSIAGAIASFALVLVVLELIRSRRLRERYALLWLLTGLVLLALSVWRGGPEHDRRLARRDAAIRRRCSSRSDRSSSSLVLLHYSTVISRLSDQNTILAQRLALLETPCEGWVV